uniref:Uncharacterized protein MANES_04G123400 n=2 Tax=Rhizophora mucronata TaxID=61149 RepID=A0A2P2IQE7_RHIMU
MSNDPKFDHIDLAEKQKVLNECVEAEAWLREKKQQQDSLPKYTTPVLLSADVRKKAEAVDRVCRPIMMKPKPAPAKPATPENPGTPPNQGCEQPQSRNTNANNHPSAGGNEDAETGNGEAPTASGEPMETETPSKAA